MCLKMRSLPYSQHGGFDSITPWVLKLSHAEISRGDTEYLWHPMNASENKKTRQKSPLLSWADKLEAGEHRCIKCGIVKSLLDFPGGRTGKTGLPRYAYCKKCHGDYQRATRLRNFFLMTVEDADLIFTYQGNLCAICKRPAHGGQRLSMDHRHSDGLVRGGLCNWCNRAIARFKDDIARLRAAADYLENPPAVQALGREHFARPGRVGTKKQRSIIRREKKASKKVKPAPNVNENAVGIHEANGTI